MSAPPNEPGMPTPLEVARCDPPLYALTLSAEFIDRICRKYFSDISTIDPTFREDLWNALEGANALYVRIETTGILAANIAGARHFLRGLKRLLEPIRTLAPAEFASVGLAMITLLQNNARSCSLELLDARRLSEELHDGNRLRQRVDELVILIDSCLRVTAPDTLPERRNWAIRAWCIVAMNFWVSRAKLKPTLTKLSESGGVRIKSALGKFSEECLSEIGVDAKYELRSAFAFAKNQIANDARLKKLICDGDMAAATNLLAKWKDRFPVAIV